MPESRQAWSLTLAVTNQCRRFFKLCDRLLSPGVDMVHTKLQALVYDILPLEEGAEKRCLECGFTLQASLSGTFPLESIVNNVDGKLVLGVGSRCRLCMVCCSNN